MKKKIIFFALILSSFLIHSQEKAIFNQNNLQLTWELLSNNYENEFKAYNVFTLTNTAKTSLPATGWSIYFNCNRSLSSKNNESLDITHINGDLYQIKPDDKFSGLNNNQSIQVYFYSGGTTYNRSAVPSGFYIVWNENSEKGYTLKNVILKPILDKNAGFITPEIRYKNNEKIKDIPLEKLPKIIPTPNYFETNQGEFIANKNTTVFFDANFKAEAVYLTKELNTVLASKITLSENNLGKNQIVLKKGTEINDSYSLNIKTNGIEISSATNTGIFYGIQSLKMLFPINSWKEKKATIAITNCQIKDAPRFNYRGLMLDVARNFQTKNTIFKLLDAMAFYKMNVFHFHFSDDEGWRIEIPDLPELTQVGAYRGHTLNSNSFLQTAQGSGPETGVLPGSGFYTKQDFIDILKYATNLHITVIPEIESPGHSRAAIKAMDFRYDQWIKKGNKQEAERYLLRDLNDKSEYISAQLFKDNVMCVALPSTYNFIQKVVDEIYKMYKEANAPLKTIHLGGDEVPAGAWEKSPLCKQLISKNPTIKSTNDLWYYYYSKVLNILSKKQLYVSGWEEIAMRKTILDGAKNYIPNPDFVKDNFTTYVWNNGIGWGAEDLPYKLANAGYKVILSCVSNLYFDLAYEKNPEEIGLYWGGYNDTEKPFAFIPFDYYKNTTEDVKGNTINPSIFENKQRLTDYGKNNILGIQGQLFSENVRNTELLDYLMYPKLLALAERSWAENPTWALEKNKDLRETAYNEAWSTFANTLGKKELPRLEHYNGGYKYRIPPVGAIVENSKVKANIQQPGFMIRYTTDGSEPTKKSAIYKEPISKKGKIILAAFNEDGRKGKNVVIDN